MEDPTVGHGYQTDPGPRAAAWSHTRLSLEPLTTGHDRVGFLSHLTICCNLAL